MPESTVAQQRQRLAEDPRDPVAFETLEEHHYLRAEWSELERLYERRLTAELRSGTPADQARILLRLGQMLERGRGDRAAALRRYREAAERAPRFRPALAALRKAHAAAGQWELVLQIAERELETPLPARARAALHLECGETWLRHAGDEEQALCHYQLALRDDPGNVEAAQRLARTLESLGRGAEAIDAWQQVVGRVDGPERARARVALARLVELELDDEARAAQLYREASRDDPHQREALTALTDLAARRGDWEQVLALQARRFELAGDPAERAHIAYGAARGRVEHAGDPAGALAWLRQAVTLRDSPGAVGPGRLLELALETARAARTAGQMDEAAEAYGVAVSLDADHPDALAGLAETRFALGDLEGATGPVQARLALEAGDQDRTLHLAIAAAGLETRGQLDEALAGYREVLAADPGHDAALAGAARILEAREEFFEAAGLVDAWAARTGDPALRSERLTRAARLARDAGEPEDEVIARLQEALARNAGNGAAWVQLASAQYETGADDEALDTTRRALGLVRQPELRAALLVTRATLLEERGDARAAASTWIAAAEERPGDRQPLFCALHLLRRLGEWRTCARILQRTAERTPRPQLRAELLCELARLRAGPLEDMNGAIEAYREALDAEPGREEARESLEKLLLYRAEPARPQDPGEERGLRGILGGLLKSPAGVPRGASPAQPRPGRG